MKILFLLPFIVLASCHTYTSTIQLTYYNGTKDTIVTKLENVTIEPEYTIIDGNFVDRSTIPSMHYASYVRSFKVLTSKKQ